MQPNRITTDETRLPSACIFGNDIHLKHVKVTKYIVQLSSCCHRIAILTYKKNLCPKARGRLCQIPMVRQRLYYVDCAYGINCVQDSLRFEISATVR